MNAPYDRETERPFQPRRDWGAYLLLFTVLVVIGVGAGAVIQRILQLIGAM